MTAGGNSMLNSLDRRFWTPDNASAWNRLFSKCTLLPNGCFVFGASRDRYGYAKFRDGGHVRIGHRLAWELTVGPIPEGMTLDHLCRTKNCLNTGALGGPSHLEPVTRSENARRAAARRRADREALAQEDAAA